MVFADIAEDVMTNDDIVLFDEWVLRWLRAHATLALTSFCFCDSLA